MAMPYRQFQVLSEAEVRRQRRLQVNACMAARSAQFEGKAFEKMIKGLSDGE